MNLFQRMEKVAARQPERLALQMQEGDGYRRATYGELVAHARAWAGLLLGEGLAVGDRVALVSENRPEWAMAYFAIAAAGGVAVPLDTQLSEAEIANVLRHAECRFAVVSGKQAERLGGAPIPSLQRLISLDAEASSDRVLAVKAAASSVPLELPRIGPEAIASILYTSGTTGLPKGVVLSHGNFLANVDSIMQFRLIDAPDNILALLPLHHAFPFMVQLVGLFSGARLTFPASLRAPDLLACMRETGVTILAGVPQLFYMLRKGIFDELGRRPALLRSAAAALLRLSGLLRDHGVNAGRLLFGAVHRRFGGRIRLMVSGGARLDPAIAKDFLALGFVLSEGYGITECSPVVAFNPLDRFKPGTVGPALPGVQIAVRSPDAEGVGEIAIRGGNVMQGYYRQPEATAEVLQDGWFLSGDLGYLDPDGYLTITGRAKEVIVLSSGKNIYPEEVEQVYLQSHYIREICLIPTSQDRGGAEVEGLMALVLPDLEYFRAQGMTNVLDTIRWDMENVGRELPAYKRPTQLRIVKEGFPRTRLGKIQRHLVRERYADEIRGAPPAAPETPQGEDLALRDDPLGRRVLEQLRRASEKPAVRLDDNLELDLGLDSLARVELLVALEGMIGVKIPDEAAAECFTVREVIRMVRGLASSGAPRPQAGARPRGWHEVLQEASPEAKAVIQNSTRPSARSITAFSRWLCLAVFKTLYRLRVEGLEHLPSSGPVILTPNHTSFFDAFIVAAALPAPLAQQIFYLGFEWFFRSRLLAWWARGVRVIPIDVDSYLIRALQASAAILREGKVLCIFPEGERSATGTVRPFRKGTGILVRELLVPVLPAYISGAFEAWPRGRSFPRIHPLRLRFGPVVTATELLHGDGPRGADDAETIVLRLQQRVEALKPSGR